MHGLSDTVLSSYVLAEAIRQVAERRARRPLRPGHWARKLLEKHGFRDSVAGFIAARARNGLFRFSDRLHLRLRLKLWDPAADEPVPKGKEATRGMSKEELECYRVAYALSLPDRLLHQVAAGFLAGTAEEKGILSESCHSYRPGRGQATAVEAVRRFAATGQYWVVRFDVRHFNETVSHSLLRRRVREYLIRAGHITPRDGEMVLGIQGGLFQLSGMRPDAEEGRGLIVGSPLTPVLTNLYLTPLDRWLEGQGVESVRYGDDVVVFCGSRRQAEQVLKGMRCVCRSQLDQKPNSTRVRGEVFALRLSVLARETALWGGEGLNEETVRRLECEQWARLDGGGKRKTDLFRRAEAFDFVGFEFVGGKVLIRPETFNKVAGRISMYTVKSEMGMGRLLRGCRDHLDDDLCFVGGCHLPLGVGWLCRAIQVLNRLAGFATHFVEAPSRSQIQIRGVTRFLGRDRNTFAASCMAAVRGAGGYEDLARQFGALDVHMKGRLRVLRSRIEGDLADGEGERIDGVSFRRLGLRTFHEAALIWKARLDKQQRHAAVPTAGGEAQLPS